MSTELKLVQWNAHKRRYDAAVAAFLLLSIIGFMLAGLVAFPAPGEVSPPILLMRALGATAVLTLHVILAIGPLARLTPLAAPLLYNRRHLGVAFFLVCLLHALVAVGFYGGFGEGTWLLNVVAGGGSASPIPFEFLGFVALAIFFVMAATSHDFWLGVLGPKSWKMLHMAVYVAYALVVGHVMLGAAQERDSLIWPIALLVGVIVLATLHIGAGLRSQPKARPDADGDWLDAGDAASIPADRARIVTLGSGASVAIFKHDGKLTAISNVCRHQGGPIGEGKVVDGCVTCPWHGYQYRPEDGCSPPPYTERLETYDVRLEGERIQVRTTPNELGTQAEAAMLPENNHAQR